MVIISIFDADNDINSIGMVTRDFIIYIYQLTEYDETNIPGKYQR